MTNRGRAAIVVALLVAFTAALVVVAQRAPPSPADAPSHYEHRSASLVFTYHVPTDTQSLFDLTADPRMLRNLAAERPADLVRLRDEMLARIGIPSLEELRRPQQDLIDRLEGLGYK